MSDIENTLVRHIVGTDGVPEVREPKSPTIPGSVVPIKGSIDEMNAGGRQVAVIPPRILSVEATPVLGACGYVSTFGFA
jgi:hypothetical protein